MSKRARRKTKAKRAAQRSTAPPPPPDFLSENWRFIATIAIALVLTTLIVWAVLQADWGEENGNGTGKEAAPGFHIVDIDDKPVALDIFRGRVVVLDLFATWCGPCRTQMEELFKLREAYPDAFVVIVSVDIDPNETVQMVRDFRDEYSADWHFAVDTDGLAAKYNATLIPTMAIIDRDGNFAWKHQGVTSFEDLQKIIDPLI